MWTVTGSLRVVGKWTRKIFEASDGPLAYYRTGGDKPPLILMHGLTDNGLCWSRVAENLEPDFDIIMLDGRGHGASSLPESGGNVDHAQDIAEFVTGLRLIAPIVLGHSIGALAAMEFAAVRGELLAKLILEDPPLRKDITFNHPERISAFRKQVTAYRSMSIEDIVRTGKKQHPNWADQEFSEWAAGKQQVDPEIAARLQFLAWQECIKRLRTPTLIIRGENDDGIVTAEKAKEARALNPRVESIALPEAGHNAHRENFHDFIQALRRFVLT